MAEVDAGDRPVQAVAPGHGAVLQVILLSLLALLVVTTSAYFITAAH